VSASSPNTSSSTSSSIAAEQLNVADTTYETHEHTSTRAHRNTHGHTGTQTSTQEHTRAHRNTHGHTESQEAQEAHERKKITSVNTHGFLCFYSANMTSNSAFGSRNPMEVPHQQRLWRESPTPTKVAEGESRGEPQQKQVY
jgi:hypothetical protein